MSYLSSQYQKYYYAKANIKDDLISFVEVISEFLIVYGIGYWDNSKRALSEVQVNMHCVCMRESV